MKFFFFSSRRRHTRCGRDWSSDVCSSDLEKIYKLVKKNMQGGVSYPRAYATAFQALFKSGDLVDISQPNNILGYRSEERRVGKECRFWWAGEYGSKRM